MLSLKPLRIDVIRATRLFFSFFEHCVRKASFEQWSTFVAKKNGQRHWSLRLKYTKEEIPVLHM